MITTKYVCDKCGAAQDSPNQFWDVGICLNIVHSYRGDNPAKYKAAQWCRACVEKMGLLQGDHSPEKQVPPAVAPTLEDIIRDIVREEVQARS